MNVFDDLNEGDFIEVLLAWGPTVRAVFKAFENHDRVWYLTLADDSGYATGGIVGVRILKQGVTK